jgi:hypothetical protein
MSSAARRWPHRETPANAPEIGEAPGEFESFVADVAGELEAFAARLNAVHPPSPPPTGAGTDVLDPWFLDPERFEWEWVSFDERVIEEPR